MAVDSDEQGSCTIPGARWQISILNDLTARLKHCIGLDMSRRLKATVAIRRALSITESDSVCYGEVCVKWSRSFRIEIREAPDRYAASELPPYQGNSCVF